MWRICFANPRRLEPGAGRIVRTPAPTPRQNGKPATCQKPKQALSLGISRTDPRRVCEWWAATLEMLTNLPPRIPLNVQLLAATSFEPSQVSAVPLGNPADLTLLGDTSGDIYAFRDYAAAARAVCGRIKFDLVIPLRCRGTGLARTLRFAPPCGRRTAAGGRRRSFRRIRPPRGREKRLTSIWSGRSRDFSHCPIVSLFEEKMGS